jgi:iron complex transport system ATP-binding protein
MNEEKRILSIDSLSIGYSAGSSIKEIQSDLNGCAYKGELIAIIGRNGSGKSTLLRTLAGIQHALGGSILYSDRDINDYKGTELARITGYISTETIRVSNMTVYDLVSLGRFPHTNWLGTAGEVDKNIIDTALESTSISKFRNRFIAELSDGERQKVMIARLLAQDTRVMLMDEPTAFLDTGSKFEIMHLLHLLAHKDGKTIIYSTHDLGMAINHSDKIWIFSDGKMMEGAPEDLMLDGSFEHLFDSSFLVFDSATGTYSFKEENTGSVFLQGEGLAGRWTREALRRAGYSVSETITNPYIRIISKPSERWELVNEDSAKKFNTIYELIRNLPRKISS